MLGHTLYYIYNIEHSNQKEEEKEREKKEREKRERKKREKERERGNTEMAFVGLVSPATMHLLDITQWLH